MQSGQTAGEGPMLGPAHGISCQDALEGAALHCVVPGGQRVFALSQQVFVCVSK